MVGEVEKQIYECLNTKQNFVVDSGAGSGKTWSLVQSLLYLTKTKEKSFKKSGQKVLCITYTKVARDEIIRRIEYSSFVNVTTIHDFLWESVSQFQIELKAALLSFIRKKLDQVNDDIKSTRNTATKKYAELVEKQKKISEDLKSVEGNSAKVKYGQYPFFKDNIISHDEVVVLSEYIFSNHPKLSRVIADTYPVIFVDEYQDTHVPVVNILTKYLSNIEHLTIGFFGDKLQKIYDTGIGDITTYADLKLIQKTENYRSSTSVISVLNQIRSDLKQNPASANIIEGSSKFYFSVQKTNLDALLDERYKLKKNDFKILYLTHSLISKEYNYHDLYQVYQSHNKSDYLTKNSDNRGRCPYADMLYDIEEIVNLYTQSKIQTLLKKTSYEVNSFESKLRLKELLVELLEIRKSKNIKDVLDFTLGKGILAKNKKMENYDFGNESKKEIYDNLMIIPYQQVINLYDVQSENTPFSTKHSTKGEEFDNVLVIIDDEAWNKYNFEKYFSNDKTNMNIYERTRNLFYVVCSRAKINLAVYFQGEPNSEALKTINQYFGSVNIHRLP